MSNKLFAAIAVVLVVALALGGAVIFIASSKRKSATTTTSSATTNANTNPNQKIALTIWRPFDDETSFKRAIDAYTQKHPNVTINYVKKDLADFEIQSINALAAGTGPDIWSIKNDWMPRHVDKLVPMPENFFVNPKKNEARSNVELYKATWAPVTQSTNISDNKVYGLPLYVDTLILYVNMNLWRDAQRAYRAANVNNHNFDDALFRNSPITWNELQQELPYLTKKDSAGNLTQAGIALGTSNNIANAADILSLLMLQNGTNMVDKPGKAARFNTFENGSDGNPVYKGTKALQFYTSFADHGNANYTWDTARGNALQDFISGKLAILVGYQFQGNTIKQQAPTLDFNTATVPQVKGSPSVNYASFWTEAVTNNSRNVNTAWDFLASIALAPSTYIQATNRSSALFDDLQATQKQDIFAEQTLSAKTWYKGKSSEKVDRIFNDLIDNVASKHQPAQSSIDTAASQATDILQKE